MISAIYLLRSDGVRGVLANYPDLTLALIVMLGAAALVAAFTAIEQRRQKRSARVALDNMTLGLGMFDGAARLVLCNRRYVEMSQLPSEVFKEGTPLRDILANRARKGSFAGDPDKYVANALKMAAEGRTIAQN